MNEFDTNVFTEDEKIHTAESTADTATASDEPAAEPVDTVFYSPDVSYAPDAGYDDKPDRLKKARSIFSLSHLALFVYMIVSTAMATFLSGAAMLFLPTSVLEMLEVDTNGTFTIIISDIAQYLIAFPIFLLMVWKLPRKKSVITSKLSFGGFMAVFVISEAVMLVGAFISNFFASLLEGFFGNISDNNVDTLVNNTPLWVLFIAVCILAPIFEELMFRKLLIDRLSVVGDIPAIIFSAAAFGIFHTSIYQILYATALGLILGYVYSKTRKIWHTMLIHGMINFFGSIIPMLVQKVVGRAAEIEELMKSGASIPASDNLIYLVGAMLSLFYTLLMFAFIGGGVALLVIFIVKKKIQPSRTRDIVLDRPSLIEAAILNPGFILMYCICLLLTILSLIPVA